MSRSDSLNPTLPTIGIDTCILYRNNPAAISPKLKLLCDLAARCQLQLVASDVVLREWEGQLVDDAVNNAQAFLAAAKKLSRMPTLPRDFHNSIMTSQMLSDSWLDSLENATRKHIRSAIDRLRIIRIAPSATDHVDTLDDFFAGADPFTSRRSRADFPDSLVYHSMLAVSREVSSFHFLSGDNVLAKAIERRGIPVFRKLDDLLDQRFIRALHRSTTFALKWEKRFRQVRDTIAKQVHELLPIIQSHVEREIRFVPLVLQDLPEGSDEASVASVQEVVAFQPDWDSARSLGEGLLQVEAMVRVRVEVDVAVYRADAYLVPDWLHVTMTDPEQHFYLPGYGIRDLLLSISFGLLFDPVDDLNCLDVKTANTSLDAIEFVEASAPLST